MYNRVLVTLDGSALSEVILPEINKLLEGSGCEVILMMVKEMPHASTEAAVEGHDRLVMLGTAPAIVPTPELQETRGQAIDSLRDEAMHYLEARASALRQLGMQVRTIVHFGSPAQLILQIAEEEKAELIAMATHGNTGLRRLLFGSVASHVLQNTSRPMLLVRPQPLTD